MAEVFHEIIISRKLCLETLHCLILDTKNSIIFVKWILTEGVLFLQFQPEISKVYTDLEIVYFQVIHLLPTDLSVYMNQGESRTGSLNAFI